jgi:hypothetical protein
MTRDLLEDKRTLWIVASLTVLLFAIANLPWQLDDYDQAKQAYASFEMILSADAPRTRSDQAAPGRMDLSRSLRNHSIMGAIVAVTIVPGCRCTGNLVVSICQLRLRINCWSRWVECVWIQSTESAPGNTRAHRHAVGVCDLPHWTADLGES